MAWSANLDKIVKSDGNVIATVTFTSDTGEKIAQDIPGNDLTKDNLTAFVSNKIQVLDVRDLAFKTLTVGPIAVPDKTPEQQAQLAALAAKTP